MTVIYLRNFIHCAFCDAIATHAAIHKDGWRLAKNRIGCYVCTSSECRHKDNAK